MRRAPAIALAAFALYFLYIFGLARTGILGPDEPRYAAIGTQMARSGDFVLPVLWGRPWYEKPPLLYWMTAAAARAGLGPDLAPRLPVALLSVAFLVFFFLILRGAFSERAALFSTAILATSAGWLAYSHIAVTDLPLSATFAAGMLLLMPRRDDRPSHRSALAAGALIGLAVLAKGLVPLVLLLPALWFLRRDIRAIALSLGAVVIVAGPWYLAISLRAGRAFFDDFIWKHHIERFGSVTLQHVQPWWFYAPVLLAAFLPWTLVAALCRRDLLADARIRFLLAWFAWGLLFFSVSLNKLPGYILPLLPAGAAILGVALDRAVRPWMALAACALCTWAIPVAGRALPSALLRGIRHADVSVSPILAVVPFTIATALLIRQHRWIAAMLLVAAATVAAVAIVVTFDYPALDAEVSARPEWQRAKQEQGKPCISGPATREFRYGLNYYFGLELPDCTGAPGEVPLAAPAAASGS